MPGSELCPGRLPPEKQTRVVPVRATPMAPILRGEILSLKSRRENTATQTGAVYSSTTAIPASRGRMNRPLRSAAWTRNNAPPKAARQKAVSSGLTPALMQILEITPISDQKKAASRIQA